MKDVMHYQGYYGSVHFDEEALIFYGKLECIRALVSYEATDAAGLCAAFKEAVDDYLHLCQEKNIQPERPFKGSLNIRLGQELHRRVALKATQLHLSINKLIADTLDKAIPMN